MGIKRDRRGAAQYLTEQGYPTAWTTLQKLACIGGGPVYRLFGNRTVYDTDDLDAWAKARTSAPLTSTSDPAHPTGRRRGAVAA